MSQTLSARILRLFLTPLLALAASSIPGAALTVQAADVVRGYNPGGCPTAGQVSYCWAPSSITVSVGQSVTWGNGTGTHGVAQTSGSWPAACPNGSLGTCSFSSPGTYGFACSIHGSVMSGSITVTGPPASPSPQPAVTPTHAVSPMATHTPAPAPSHTPSAPPTPVQSPVVPVVPSPQVDSQASSPTPVAVLPDSPRPSTAAAPAASSGAAPSRGFPVLPVGLAALLLVGGTGGFIYSRRGRP